MKSTIMGIVGDGIRFVFLVIFIVLIVGVTTASGGENRVVLISAGKTLTDNTGYHSEYWYNLFLMYETAIVKYGYSHDNVYVLYGDGNDFVSANTRYQKSFHGWTNPITDYSVSKLNVQNIFSWLANGNAAEGISAMTDEDCVFVWWMGHGSPDPTYPDIYMSIQNTGETVRDHEFASYVNVITHYFRRTCCFMTCFSGGMIGDLQNNKTIVITAVDDRGTESNMYDVWHAEFSYHLACALHGQTPTGVLVNADYNTDAMVTMDEAHQYTFTNRTAASNPQYSDLGTIGPTTSMEAIWISPIIAEGLNWLTTVQNTSDGSWAWADGTGPSCVGMTGLAVLAFINHYGWDAIDGATDPAKRGLDYILSQQVADGSIYSINTPWGEPAKVYETSLAIPAIAAACLVVPGGPVSAPLTYKNAIYNASKYLFDTQCIEASSRSPDPQDNHGYVPGNPYYGGHGYPRNNWADLSNTQFSAWGLRTAWQANDDWGYQFFSPQPSYPYRETTAKGFISRCQDATDHGFAYQPGGVSYGSMAAAGIWSLWCWHVAENDSRVQDAKGWFDANFESDENPLVPAADPETWYYYYLFTAAKAFKMYGWESIAGRCWYNEFRHQLITRQENDGSWPDCPGWSAEGEPKVMTTSEALLTLETNATILAPGTWRAILASPGELHIEDPMGREDSEIPGIEYSAQAITLNAPMPSGPWKVRVVGVGGGGLYTLSVDGHYGDNRVYSDKCMEIIQPGEEHEWKVILAKINGPLTMATNFPPPPTHGLIPNTEECVNPGEYVCLPILLDNNTTPFGGFELEVEFDYTSMTFVGAEPGEAMEGFEHFTYRLLPCPACGCCKYKILLYGQYDLPNGVENIGDPIPLTPPGEYKELVNLCFVVNNDENLRGLKIPVCWEWEGTVVNDTLVEDWECGENTFSSWSGDTLFVSNLLCQFNPDICDDPGDRIQPILIFQDGICGQNCGGVDVCPAGPGECKRGDVNYNTMTYEVADAVLFASYFVEGLGVFRYDEAYQICATDVNADGRTLTLSDLVYFIRVILHDAVAIPKLTPSSEVANVIVSGGIISTECAAPIGAILFEFDSAVNPTLLAGMEMVNKDNKVLVWSSKGKSFSTAEVLTFEGEAELVTATAVDRDSRELTTAITGKVVPPTFALHPAYPNPFNPFTTLSFNLPEAVDYTLRIYNVAGQLVRSYEDMGSVGLNMITWDSKDNTGVEVASGVYFYKLTAGGFSATEKMVILK